ncbi:MAG: hypothetical protein V3V18_13015 [Methylococcales bacterium]
MKKLILKMAVLTALTASIGAQAYTISESVADDRDMFDFGAGTINEEFTMDGGKFYRVTHDGNDGREVSGSISAIEKNGTTRVNVFSSERNFGTSISSHKGNIIRKDDELITIFNTKAVDAAGNPTVTVYSIDESSITPGDGIRAADIADADSAVAYDSDTGNVYFTGRGNVDGNIYKFDTNTQQTTLFSEYREVEPETNGREVSIFAEDMEWVDGALWILQGADSDLHKIAADGTYLGRDKVTGQSDNSSDFRLEGLGFDETTGEFWATSHLQPVGGEKGDYYVSLTNIGLDTPPAEPSEPTTTCTLDTDGNASVDALTDGLLFIRHMFGSRGDSLIDSAVGAGCTRCTATEIETYMDQCAASDTSDIDGNGEVDALTDGLLDIRYLFGSRGEALITDAVGDGCTRCTAAEVEGYLQGLIP